MFVEVLGYIGLFFGVSSYLFKSDKGFKIFQLIANVFFSIHLFELNSVVGAFSCFIGFVSISFNLYNEKLKINKIFPLIYIALFVYSVFNFNISEWFEVLPAISNLFWCYGILHCKGQKINYLMLFVIGIWIVYSIQLETLSMLLTQVIILLVLISRMIRLHINK